MPRLFVGVERSTHPSPIGIAINVATRARFVHPAAGWTIAGGPATHAFVVVQEDNRTAWRLDGTHPAAGRGAYYPPTHGTENALWEVVGGDVAAGAAKALALVGTPYDLAELFQQALAPLAEVTSLRPGVPYNGRNGGSICTGIACDVLRAVGGTARAVAEKVMTRDHYPEELGQALLAYGLFRPAGEPWALRVDPKTLEPLTNEVLP